MAPGTADTTAISYGLPTTNDLSIGNYPVPTANFPDCGNLAFSGKIDEVHVFNRALGAQEIHLGYVASGYLPPAVPRRRDPVGASTRTPPAMRIAREG